MAHEQKKFIDFFKSRWGMAVLFVLIFYVLTFLVYYFYSPGPEERRQAELAKAPATSQTQAISGSL